MRHLLVIYLLCLRGIESFAQCNDWENLLTFESVYVQDTHRDRFGNLYAVGSFNNPSFIIGSTAIPYFGGHTIFILKFDKNLNVIWGKSFGNGSTCMATHVDVDHEDNLVVSGLYHDGPLTFDCILLPNSGHSDIFVAKFFHDGVVQWAKHSTGTNDEYGTGLVISKSNDVIIVGSFVEGSGSFEDVPVQSFGGYDSFIVKLTSMGGVEWASSIGGSGGNLPDYILGVDVDFNNNVVITGMFESEKLSIGSFTIDRKTISENYFVAKFNSVGQALWAKGTGLNVDVSGYAVKVGTDGNIYVLGRFYSGMITVDGFTLTSTGDADAMLIKYSSDGNALAAINFGGTDFDSGTKLDLDPFGNVVASGYYYSISFHIGPFTELKAESASDLFVIKFDNDLNALCLSRVTGNAEVSLQSLDVDDAGNIWISVQNMFGFGQVVFNTDYVVESDVHTMIVSINDVNDFDAGLPEFEFDVELGEGEEMCSGDDAVLDAGEWCNAIITWQDGSHNRFYEVIHPGEYWVEVEVNGVVARDSVVFLALFPETLDLGKDTTLCAGQSLLLDAGDYCGISYEWQNGSTSSTFLVTQSGVYSVLIKNGTNMVSDAITVSYHPEPEVNLGEDKRICDGEFIAFDVTQSFPSQYLWSNGSTLPTLTISDQGTFWVKVENVCQIEYDTITISRPGPLVVELGEDRTICTGNSIVLGGVVTNAVSYAWQDGTTEPELNVSSSGNFSVVVSNGCVEKADSIRVSVVNQNDLTIPNVITPNDDEANDLFIVPEELKGSQLQIYNRWGEDIYYNSSYQNTWMGEDQSAGVYYYTLQGVCPMAIKGTIHLLKH